MSDQSCTQIFPSANIFEILFTVNCSSSSPSQYDAIEFGFELEEQEIASELAAFNAGDVPGKTVQVDPDEFDATYQWFIS